MTIKYVLSKINWTISTKKYLPTFRGGCLIAPCKRLSGCWVIQYVAPNFEKPEYLINSLSKEVDNEGKEKVQKYGLVRKWIGLKSKFYVACEVQVLTTATNQRKKINRYLLKGQRYCNFQIKFSSALWSPARKYLSTRSSVAPRRHIILVVKKRRAIALFFYLAKL